MRRAPGRKRSTSRAESLAARDLKMLAEVLSGGVGEHHLRVLAEALGRALGVDMVIIGQLAGAHGDQVESVAVYHNGKMAGNMTFSLENSPCAPVLGGALRIHRSGVRELFPMDRALAELQAESYAGTPLVDSLGRVLGLLSVISSRRIKDEERVVTLLRIFAARAALELERLLTDQQMFRQITSSTSSM